MLCQKKECVQEEGVYGTGISELEEGICSCCVGKWSFVRKCRNLVVLQFM